MSIIDFFDADNVLHLKAWSYFNETGFWPINFLPQGVEYPAVWRFILLQKIAKKWISYKGAQTFRVIDKKIV